MKKIRLPVVPLVQLPFYDVSNDELLKVTGAWVHSLASTALDPKDPFQAVIESPEKTFENVNTACGNYIESKYHAIKQTGLFFDKIAHKKGFLFSLQYVQPV